MAKKIIHLNNKFLSSEYNNYEENDLINKYNGKLLELNDYCIKHFSASSLIQCLKNNSGIKELDLRSQAAINKIFLSINPPLDENNPDTTIMNSLKGAPNFKNIN